jgi:hypothetical protein
MPLLAEWDSFYVIVGSAAGALVGLQFVVITLMAQAPPINALDAGAAFGTPTTVHLSTPLFLAALIRAPWHSLIPIAAIWGLIGIGGTAYGIVTALRMLRQQRYSPVMEDWLFHLVLPILAYLGLVASAFAVVAYPTEALFGVGSAVLLLLLVGIHNAWDNVSYHVFVNLPNRHAEANKASPTAE